MKLVSVVALFSVLMLALASFAGAAPAPKPLKTFGTGAVTTGTDSATIVIDPGEYGGVYVSSKSQGGKTLNQRRLRIHVERRRPGRRSQVEPADR